MCWSWNNTYKDSEIYTAVEEVGNSKTFEMPCVFFRSCLNTTEQFPCIHSYMQAF